MSLSIRLFLLFTLLVIVSCQSKKSRNLELIIIPLPEYIQDLPPSESRYLLINIGTGERSFVYPLGVQDIRSGGQEPGSFTNIGVTVNNWGPGAEHAFNFDQTEYGIPQFEISIKTEPDFPLTFKVGKEGYVYLCGAGTVILQDGSEYVLGYNITDDQWINGLKSTEHYIRQGSCEALGRLGVKNALPHLLSVLNDTIWEVRRNACESLGLLGDLTVVPDLEKMLNDENEHVRDAAEYSINQIRGTLEENLSKLLMEAVGTNRYMFITRDTSRTGN
ncbi:MAG: HEAT repeat domain-containing protein [Bacteroidales bacterium]|nr:HEAT repeat domain-containing protein [Bacteroidales bacterium]